MRLATISAFFGALFVLSACGNTTEEQAATGGLAGLAVGGPVGAAVGAGAGAVAGDEIQEGVDEAL